MKILKTWILAQVEAKKYYQSKILTDDGNIQYHNYFLPDEESPSEDFLHDLIKSGNKNQSYWCKKK